MYSSFLLLNHCYICVHWASFFMHPPLEDVVETSANVVEAQAVPLCATQILSALKLRCTMGAALGAGSNSTAIGKEIKEPWAPGFGEYKQNNF